MIPGLGRPPGEGNGNPLQSSCLENPVDRGAWRATVHGVTESDTTEATCQARAKHAWCLFTRLSLLGASGRGMGGRAERKPLWGGGGHPEGGRSLGA